MNLTKDTLISSLQFETSEHDGAPKIKKLIEGMKVIDQGPHHLILSNQSPKFNLIVVVPDTNSWSEIYISKIDQGKYLYGGKALRLSDYGAGIDELIDMLISTKSNSKTFSLVSQKEFGVKLTPSQENILKRQPKEDEPVLRDYFISQNKIEGLIKDIKKLEDQKSEDLRKLEVSYNSRILALNSRLEEERQRSKDILDKLK